MTVGPRAARVRGRPQLAQEAQLLERRLELRARLRPLDALQRAQGRLDRGPLAAAGEVRPEPRAQAARTPDVERQALAPAEDVDARPGRRARDEGALHVQPPRAGRRELDEVGERPRAPLLREPEQAHEDLRRGLRVGERPVARHRRDAEEVGERREAEAARPLRQQPLREPDGVDDGRRDAPPGEELDLAVEEAEVEARVVRDERRVAGEREEPAHRELDPGRPAEGGRLDARQRGHGRRQRRARVDERLEGVLELEGAHALRPDLADPRSSAASGRSSRGRRRRSARARAGRRALPAPRARPTPPRQARRASPATTSSSSERARAVGALARAKRLRAASSAATGPRRASTSSTRRSAASKESCTRPIVREHTFAYNRIRFRQLRPRQQAPAGAAPAKPGSSGGSRPADSRSRTARR